MIPSSIIHYPSRESCCMIPSSIIPLPQQREQLHDPIIHHSITPVERAAPSSHHPSFLYPSRDSCCVIPSIIDAGAGPRAMMVRVRGCSGSLVAWLRQWVCIRASRAADSTCTSWASLSAHRTIFTAFCCSCGGKQNVCEHISKETHIYDNWQCEDSVSCLAPLLLE
jgi:hypothetical protein